jgi:CTP synthase
MTKHIFITGGVVSSLGKGIASATLGALLQSRGYKVRLRKLDPYLNVDPGTMNPTQHGEVFVTDDGAETDLDLGHYERFTGISCQKNDNITTGQVYSQIISKERKGDYLGGTVQVIPHVTDIIKKFILDGIDNIDFALSEIGGTVGDIEALPFFESIRQLGFELGKQNVVFIHLTYLPYIKMAKELKTKPTQHSVKTLQALGIQPDILLCRADTDDIESHHLSKISKFGNVKRENVIPALNANNIYEVPLMYHKAGLDKQILEHFSLPNKTEPDLDKWEKIVDTITNPEKEVNIAIVGKYVDYQDSYKSLTEALQHGAIANKAKLNIVWIDARKSDNDLTELKLLNKVDGILVPGGFGKSGVEGKIRAIQYARENKVPYLGICFGMQMAVVEYARNILGLKDAHSSEITKTKNPVICLITEWTKSGKKNIRSETSDLGGTMRLGAYEAILKKGSLLEKIYKTPSIYERHRHRYEVNDDYRMKLEKTGMIFSGLSPDGELPECIELKDHPFFVGVQFHPELKSRPFEPSPIFKSFIEASIKNSRLI